MPELTADAFWCCWWGFLFVSTAAHAYLGRGMDSPIVSTFFVLFAAIASAFVVLLTWPFRWVLKQFFRPKRSKNAARQTGSIVDWMDRIPN